MNKAGWYGLVAAVLAGIAVGTTIALEATYETPPLPSTDIAFVRPPAATFAPIFEPCAHCHQIGVGARATTGPALEGLIGRKAGLTEGYPYSEAMRNSGLTWNEATLDRFIADPQAVVPGTRMVYAGMEDPVRRKALVGFIAKGTGAE